MSIRDRNISRRTALKGTAAAAGLIAAPTVLVKGAWAQEFRNDPTNSPTVTFGFNVPQSGAYADEGADELRAYELAVKHLNGEGDGVALRRFTDEVAAVVDEVDRAALADGMPPLVADPELAVRAFTGQVVEVLRWWIEAGAAGRQRPARDDVVLQLRRLAVQGRTTPADPRRRSPFLITSDHPTRSTS